MRKAPQIPNYDPRKPDPLAQEIERLEASIARMDEADDDEVDSDEYEKLLRQLVKARELYDAH